MMILLLNPAQNYILGIIVENENWGMGHISWGTTGKAKNFPPPNKIKRQL
jgi:hypothetical protein